MNEYEESAVTSSSKQPTNGEEQPSVGLVAPETETPFFSSLSGQKVMEDSIPASILERFANIYQSLQNELSKVFVGQSELMLGSLVALFAGGHILIESVPGLGKTLFASALGRALGCDFGRIQFTPDLMPSDVVGAPVFNIKTQEFNFHAGPIFTQILLADEINRAPAKTHAALLEAMQESAATVDGVTRPLPSPFFVIATQNPIESEGTYRLPEAQIDRFMFKIVADYPSEDEEFKILSEHGKNIDVKDKLATISPLLNSQEILELRKLVNNVYVAPQLYDYINKIVRATRNLPRLAFGASTRAGLALTQGARALAIFQGRGFATPDDVVRLTLPALRHRVTMSPEAEIEGRSVDEILTSLVRSIDVPRD